MSDRHQPLIIKFPVLISVGPEPVSRIVVPFVGKTDGDPIFAKSPQFLDQPVVELARPFPPEKGDDLLPADQELRAVAPPALRTVGERDSLGIARVPSILRNAYLLDGSLKSKRRQRRPGFRSRHGEGLLKGNGKCARRPFPAAQRRNRSGAYMLSALRDPRHDCRGLRFARPGLSNLARFGAVLLDIGTKAKYKPNCQAIRRFARQAGLALDGGSHSDSTER